MGDKLSASQETSASEKTDEDSDRFEIRLRDGTPFGHAISALQKAIRRGLEEDALVLAADLYDSNYGAALGKRLVVISAEDVGLADPIACAHVCSYVSTWLALRKDQKHQPDMLLLVLSVMILCRCKKNREVDSALVYINSLAKSGQKRAKDVIAKMGDLAIDSHTKIGKARIREEAAKAGMKYEDAAWADFLQRGAVLANRIEVDEDKWGKLCYAMLGYDFDAMMRTQDEEMVSVKKPEESKLSGESGSSQER